MTPRRAVDERSFLPSLPLGVAATKAVATILVVDGDAVSRRFVERALSMHSGFAVEAVADAASALELLRTQVVDLVLADTVLPDANGIAFHRRLAQEQRLRAIPFVFLSADARTATKVLALRAGADDYLTKPCEVTELVARIEAIVGRRARALDRLRARTYVLAGDFSAIAFPDLVGIIEMGRRTGTLSVVASQAVGEVLFDDGRVVHARFGNLAGEEAFYRFVAEASGHFELALGELPDDAPRTIRASAAALIMEGARRFDDSRRDSVDDVGVPPPSSRIPAVGPASAGALVPPLSPDRAVARHYESALRDGFTLGEMRLWTEDELLRWTRAEGGRDRLHVHLVADLAAGVSSVLALAGAPTERWVLGGISPEPKAFGLSFFLRHDRILDLVLLDVRAPMAFANAMGRVPTISMIAPPEGDLLAVGVRGRVAIEDYLRALRPPVVVGVGTRGLDRELRRIDLGGAALRCAQGILGHDATDLREMLLVGLRVFAELADTTEVT